MFIQFFKKDNPASYILLPLFAIVLWGTGFFYGQDITVEHSMPFYEMLTQPLVGMPLLATLLAFILVVGEAFLLNFIVNENEVLSGTSFLPALFYILFMSNDKAKLALNPMIFANLFILLAFYKLISSYRKNIAFSQAFDAGLLFSIAIFFYLPSIVLLPLLGIGLLIFRTFNWREWVISCIGVLVPISFALTYYFWYDIVDILLYDKFAFTVFPELPTLDYSLNYYFMIGFSGFIVMLSIGKLLRGSTGLSQKTKQGILYFKWIFIFALLTLFFSPEISMIYLSFLAIPASVFCANYFLRIKKQWWGEFLFLALLITILINHVFY